MVQIPPPPRLLQLSDSISLVSLAQYIDETLTSRIAETISAESKSTEELATRFPFSTSSDVDVSTVSEELVVTRERLVEQHWFNLNQTTRKDPFRSALTWTSVDGTRYVLSSIPLCLRQMCLVTLKYNGSLSTSRGGCLSFSLTTRGQPGTASKSSSSASILL